MKKLPIGLQNFKNIIEEGYLYVDKTKQIYELIDQGKLYFLSRPRRFGKTLLLSTLKEIFLGNKDLFKGLFIAEQTNYNWKPCPVLQFNFAKIETEPSDLQDSLKRQIQLVGQKFNIKITSKNLMDQVEELVRIVAEEHGPVVFLVDEYDKPIIDFLTKKESAKANRQTLKKFFAPLKSLEEQGHIRFLFITGISKFSKVSIFSDLNNLTDLTVNQAAVDLMGITEQELGDNFGPYIQKAIDVLQLPKAELLTWVKTWYNGYSWDGKTFVYNPYSLLSFFANCRFGNFWFATGTPTFLTEIIKERNILPADLPHKEFLEVFFDKFSIEQLDIYNLLFQTGYLTIKQTTFQDGELRYKLNYPNREVQQSFVYNLLETFTFQNSNVVGDALLKIRDALRGGDIAVFTAQLRILLADISYHLLPKKRKIANSKNNKALFAAWEGYFQTIIYLVCSFLSFSVLTEITKHKGRLDLLVETDDFLYLMEFKLEESAKDAIAQIKARQYAQSYKNSTKRVLLVGIGFSKKERNVESWEVEEWKDR